MDRRKGVPYKSSVLDIDKDLSDDNEVDSNGNVIPNHYRTHTFDRTIHIAKKRKKFILHISGPLETARGKINIRTIGKFKVNES